MALNKKWKKHFGKNPLHWLFTLGIVFKGLDGLIELAGGFFFLFFTTSAMTGFVFHITRSELLEDPDDLIANSLRHAFDQLSAGSKIFVAAYLLGHGVIKLVLVMGLLLGKRWVFPVACVVLLGFIGYQVYRLCGHFSIGLTLFTGLDAIIIALVWHEYRSLEKHPRGRK